MKWLNGYRISLVLVGFVAAVVLGGGSAKADFTFGTPMNLGPTVNSSTLDAGPSISADGLTLFFDSERPGGMGGQDIWITTRETTGDDWGVPVNLGPMVNSAADEYYPEISADGLSLYFSDGLWSWDVNPRQGGFGQSDIWVATRETTDDDWGTPVNLGQTINSSAYECDPSISIDGLSLYFGSNRPGGSGGNDLWVTTRPTIADPWGPPMNLGSTVNSSDHDIEPSLSSDGLVLFFMSTRSGGVGNYDLWVTMRASTDDDWEPPVNLGPTVNSSVIDVSPFIQADGSTLLFMSERIGGYGTSDLRDLWQVSIDPVVDLNRDGIVESADMCIIVDHWGEDYPLCDIGPMPWGDGVVDVQDLIVFAEHLFEDYRLIAHWNLDEAEGNIAHDSANGNDGTVYGDPAWQPEIGMVYGALEFDGTDDYVSTPFILNPAEGPFSVFTWVKGGAPGQVVLSQMGGARWLCADPSEGNLMIKLKAAGRGANELLSQTVITDGNWHRIGLVWDGSNRTLYVDGVAVAEDTQTNLEGSENGLYIGAGTAMETGSFWSGLIDDVRIYNRAVIP